jgi:hypothetical protein
MAEQEKQDWTLEEVGRLTMILGSIFETLPKPGEDRALTWEKIGRIQALVWEGLLGKDWYEMQSHERDKAIRQAFQGVWKKYGGEDHDQA